MCNYTKCCNCKYEMNYGLCFPASVTTAGVKGYQSEDQPIPIFKGHLVMPALLAPLGCGKVVEQDTHQPRPAQRPLHRELRLLF